MKIICAPDSFKGSLTSIVAAKTMARGIAREAPDAIVDICPVGDGGEGTLSALLSAIQGNSVTVTTVSGLGQSIVCATGWFPESDFSYVESASVLGSGADRVADVMAASSFGVGRLMLKAAARTAKVLIGLGGSLSNDGGTGLAQAFGVRFLDEHGAAISDALSGSKLADIRHIDLDSIDPTASKANIVALCDVRNTFYGPEGAACIFAAQKGATTEQVQRLDEGLANLAKVVQRDLGIDLQTVPGAGAAGGLGGGLLAFAGATLTSGIESVLDVIGFRERIGGASLVLTGEGCMDRQTLSGKACLGVAAAAKEAGVPAIALVGQRGDGADECLASGLRSIQEIGPGLPLDESIARAEELLESAAARAVRATL